MNPVIKAQLSEFIRENHDELKDESVAFEVMSIFSVENGILGESVNPFDVHLKGQEFGIDGIAILVQGDLCIDTDDVQSALAIGKNHKREFHFFQSKTSEKFDYGDISKFLDGIYDFFTENKLVRSVQIDDLAAAKDAVFQYSAKSNPSICCFYCSTGGDKVSDDVQALITANKKRLENLNIFSSIEIQCLGAKAIQSGYRSATHSTKASIDFKNQVTLPPFDRVEEAFIGYISANQLINLALAESDENGIRDINFSVFYDNVRDYNPESEINKSILADLKSSENGSFVFKNNGVTVVSKSISRKGDSFTIEDYQIVNGCQTTCILAYSNLDLTDVYVPLRLIVSQDRDFVASIIIGTNKQNEVREDQFWALLPFMKDLEEYFANQDGDGRIYIERRENQYRSSGYERTKIMKPSDLMKAVAAMFFYQPHRAARDHRGIRKEFSDRIFKESHSVQLYHTAALALNKFDYLVRTGKVKRAYAIYKFYCLFSLAREQWEHPTLLDAPPKSQTKTLQEILKIVEDNDAFASFAVNVSNRLEELVAKQGATNREKIRDLIRSESFVLAFSKEFF